MSLYERLRPAVVIMDVRMPRLDGIAATQAICALDPAAKVIVLTDYADEALACAASAAGALAFVPKDKLLDISSHVARALCSIVPGA